MIHQADKVILSQSKPLLPFMVTWRGYPLSFHTNVSQGKCYCVCRDDEATRFACESDARAKASRHGLVWDQHCTCVLTLE
jgi:hypothetical protein